MKFFWVILILAIVLAPVVGWYASGRDLRTISDGLSTDFRNIGTQVADAQTVAKLEELLPKAKRAVTTERDADLYKAMETYTVFLNKGFKVASEGEAKNTEARIEFDVSQKRKILESAQADLNYGQLLLKLAAQCRLHFSPAFPYKGGLADDTLSTLPKTDSDICDEKLAKLADEIN